MKTAEKSAQHGEWENIPVSGTGKHVFKSRPWPPTSLYCFRVFSFQGKACLSLSYLFSSSSFDSLFVWSLFPAGPPPPVGMKTQKVWRGQKNWGWEITTGIKCEGKTFRESFHPITGVKVLVSQLSHQARNQKIVKTLLCLMSRERSFLDC